MTVKQKAVSKWVVLLLILALAIPIITDSGCCETLTIHEDGTASDCYGHYYSREQVFSEVLRYQGSCFNTGPEHQFKTVSFESEEAYQRFVEEVRRRIDAGWQPGEQMLEILEYEHRPGSGGGTDLPSTTTEGGASSGKPGISYSGGGGGGGGGK